MIFGILIKYTIADSNRLYGFIRRRSRREKNFSERSLESASAIIKLTTTVFKRSQTYERNKAARENQKNVTVTDDDTDNEEFEYILNGAKNIENNGMFFRVYYIV